MGSDNTWISLHRKFLNWQWYKNINVKILFLHLLLKANYKENNWQDIVIKRGQLITSVKNLSEETGLTEQQTRTALSKLKSTHEITIETTSKYSLVSIVKYDLYQSNNKKTTSTLTNDTTINQQTNNKQITTNNKENKENNIFSYFINKYNALESKRFNDKMRFLREIKQDEKYTQLNEEDVDGITDYVLKN